MGFLDFLKREDIDAAYQAGVEYGEALAEIEPGLAGVALAYKQCDAGDLAEAVGFTVNEVGAFDDGLFKAYMKKARGKDV